MLATFKTCIARALFIPPLPLSRARIHSSHSTHGRIDISQLRSPIVCRNILHISSVNVPRPNRFLEFCQNTVTYFFFFFFFSSAKIPPPYLPRQRSETRILVPSGFSFISADKSTWNVIRCLDIVRFDCSLNDSFQRVQHERIDRTTCVSKNIERVFLCL